MLKPAPPISNYDRQVDFCRRHPGYYARYKSRRRRTHQDKLAAQAQALAGATPAQSGQPSAPAAGAQLLLFGPDAAE